MRKTFAVTKYLWTFEQEHYLHQIVHMISIFITFFVCYIPVSLACSTFVCACTITNGKAPHQSAIIDVQPLFLFGTSGLTWLININIIMDLMMQRSFINRLFIQIDSPSCHWREGGIQCARPACHWRECWIQCDSHSWHWRECGIQCDSPSCHWRECGIQCARPASHWREWGIQCVIPGRCY